MFGVQMVQPGGDARLGVEQDFVVQLRRLQRAGEAWLAVNILLSNFPDFLSQDAQREQALDRLREWIITQRGQIFRMGNEDVVVLLPPRPDRLAVAALLEKTLQMGELKAEAWTAALHFYAIPEDYAALRERAEHYIAVARAAAPGGSASAELALKSENVRGPLTPYSLYQISRVIADLDMARFIRTQPVYEKTPNGWRPLFVECHVGLNDLKLEKFPRINLEQPLRLFRDVCVQLDGKLLREIAQRPEPWQKLDISLNVSVDTVLGPAFAQFCHAMPTAQRGRMGFELDRADLLLDLGATLGAIQQLKHEGFFVVLDGILPAMLPYVNLQKFGADYIKLWVERDALLELRKPEVQRALASLPASELIFCHCDNEQALRLGESLQVTKYQGWLVDDRAAKISR